MEKPSQPTNYSLRLHPTCQQRMEDIARRHAIPIEYFITLAIAEKVSRVEHEEWSIAHALIPPSRLPRS